MTTTDEVLLKRVDACAIRLEVYPEILIILDIRLREMSHRTQSLERIHTEALKDSE